MSSLFKFEKYLKSRIESESATKKVFCRSCFAVHQAKDMPLDCSCGVKVREEGLHNTLYHTPLKQSIKYLLQTSSISSALIEHVHKMRFSSVKDSIADVFDSTRYRELEELHFSLHGEGYTNNNIEWLSLSVNMDGVQVSKTSKNSLIPVLVTINELPSHLRNSQILMPLAVMKTPENEFSDKLLSPIIEELNDLSTNGVDWVDPFTKDSRRTYIYCHCLCCDAPMKAKLLGMAGHGAKYSCPCCKKLGESK